MLDRFSRLCLLFALAGFAPLPVSAATAGPIAPACVSHHHREFDYFVGNYTVFDPSGKQIGTDEVSLAMDGCALLERWHGRTIQGVGYSGYDDTRKQWVQTFF